VSRIAREFCLLPPGATPADTHTFKCGVGGHSHLTFFEVYGLSPGNADVARQIRRLGPKYLGLDGWLQRGEIAWLCFPKVLRLVLPATSRKRIPGLPPMNDLSARFGEYLAACIRRRQPWALVMQRNIVRAFDAPQGAPPLRQSFAEAMVELAVVAHEPDSD